MRSENASSHQRRAARANFLLAAIVFVALVQPTQTQAHPCPYDWNVELPRRVSVRNFSVIKAAEKINKAVAEATGSRIKTAMILELRPVTITPVLDDPTLGAPTKGLIARYHERMKPVIAKGLAGYETSPAGMDIAPNVPLCCQLAAISAMTEMQFEQTERRSDFPPVACRSGVPRLQRSRSADPRGYGTASTGRD